MANVINVGGGDLNDFSLSSKTVRIAGAAAVKETAEKVKFDFKKLVEESLGGKKVLIVHADGKSLAQFHDQIKSVEKRLSVIVSSPDLAHDQVLSVPITLSNVQQWPAPEGCGEQGADGMGDETFHFGIWV